MRMKLSIWSKSWFCGQSIHGIIYDIFEILGDTLSGLNVQENRKYCGYQLWTFNACESVHKSQGNLTDCSQSLIILSVHFLEFIQDATEFFDVFLESCGGLQHVTDKFE